MYSNNRAIFLRGRLCADHAMLNQYPSDSLKRRFKIVIACQPPMGAKQRHYTFSCNALYAAKQYGHPVLKRNVLGLRVVGSGHARQLHGSNEASSWFATLVSLKASMNACHCEQETPSDSGRQSHEAPHLRKFCQSVIYTLKGFVSLRKQHLEIGKVPHPARVWSK